METVTALYWIGFLCAMFGPMKDQGLMPARGYPACYDTYQNCINADDFSTCLWTYRDDPRVQITTREEYIRLRQERRERHQRRRERERERNEQQHREPWHSEQ